MFNNQDLIRESDKLYRFACKLTRNKDDADDLLQSTLLRAMEKKHLFQAGTNLFSWSSKIMYNLFVSAYRRKTTFETQYDPESYIERQSTEAEQDIIMDLKDVEMAMGNLSADHYEILMLVCVNGMQYAEVSEVLDIPVGTVRSRLSRARESLMVEMNTIRPDQSPEMITRKIPVQNMYPANFAPADYTPDFSGRSQHPYSAAL